MGRWITKFVLRCRSLVASKRVDAELDDELHFHLERHIEAQVCRGVTPEEARRHTPPGGHVAVEASCTASLATITIKDDGIGISPEFLPHVFDGFQQDPRAVAATARGLGLGLSIARHFVERHGGSQSRLARQTCSIWADPHVTARDVS